jgi:predicted MFS family arabinose efflux permease
MPTTAQARRATSAMFLVCGTVTSAWAPMVPFAKSRLGLDESALGLVLLALGGGSMVAMPLAGIAIHRWSSRPVVIITGAATCLTLPLLSAPSSAFALAAALFMFGAALGALDVSMNAQAISVQRAAGRPIMSGFHGLFSIGGLVGALGIGFLLRAGLSLQSGAVIVGVVLLGLVLAEARHLVPEEAEAGGTASFRIVPSPRVLAIGALCFISFLAEGVVLDWSAVFLRELRRVDVSLAGTGYAAFSVAMAAGRLTGDRVTHGLGSARVLRLGALVAAAGFVAVAVLPRAWGALIGFVAVGLGASNIVPVLFTAAGHVRGVPSGIALATVTTIAYAGLLVGPALVGFVADATSLNAAFVVVAAMLALVSIGAGRVVSKS